MEVRQQVDPVLVAIITNRMTAIAEEMAQTLMMTSRSGIFAEARDFVTAIFDQDARLITQSEFFPGFAGALPHVLPTTSTTATSLSRTTRSTATATYPT